MSYLNYSMVVIYHMMQNFMILALVNRNIIARCTIFIITVLIVTLEDTVVQLFQADVLQNYTSRAFQSNIRMVNDNLVIEINKECDHMVEWDDDGYQTR